MIPSDNAILQVSYLGYVTEEIKVKGRRNINVMLNEDSKALDEVVVVGYGQQKKEKRSRFYEFHQTKGYRCPFAKPE